MSKIIGFSNDPHLRDSVIGLIQKHGIDLVFETGTYIGSTTKALAELCKSVHTCEVVKESYEQAKFNLTGVPNVTMYHGSSPDIIKHFFDNVLGEKKRNILFYLDAHWNGTPLIEELKAIAASGHKPVIVIHDFKVPGKDFGFDTYNGQDYTWEWIEPHIKAIYGKDFEYSYNTEAAGSYRGVIFIEPKVATKEETKTQPKKETTNEPKTKGRRTNKRRSK